MDTFIQKFAKARATNSTATSFTNGQATLTQPSGTGVLSPPTTGQYTRGVLQVVPYGVGSDNQTMNVRVRGWRPTENNLWVPVMLVQAACTLGASVGVAASDVLNTERFADTITLSVANTGVDSQAVSPANDSVGHFVVDTKGFPIVEVLMTVGTATSANALVAWI